MISHKELMLLDAAPRPFSREGWLFELKYDGYRVLVSNDGERVRLVSRNGRDLAPAFPELLEDLQNLPPKTVLDGELVVMDMHGLPRFQQLRRRALLVKPASIEHAARHEPAALFIFDLLMLKGVNYRRYALRARKHRLAPLMRNFKRVLYAEHVEERGIDLYVEAARMELEGIVAKRADAPYVAGRSAGWVKIKTPAGRERDRLRFQRSRRSKAGAG
jgi:bifunctional non-homologous end joining protein LigD